MYGFLFGGGGGLLRTQETVSFRAWIPPCYKRTRCRYLRERKDNLNWRPRWRRMPCRRPRHCPRPPSRGRRGPSRRRATTGAGGGGGGYVRRECTCTMACNDAISHHGSVGNQVRGVSGQDDEEEHEHRQCPHAGHDLAKLLQSDLQRRLPKHPGLVHLLRIGGQGAVGAHGHHDHGPGAVQDGDAGHQEGVADVLGLHGNQHWPTCRISMAPRQPHPNPGHGCIKAPSDGERFCTQRALFFFFLSFWHTEFKGGVSAPRAHRVRYLNNFSRRWCTGRGVVDGTWWALRRYHSP